MLVSPKFVVLVPSPRILQVNKNDKAGFGHQSPCAQSIESVKYLLVFWDDKWQMCVDSYICLTEKLSRMTLKGNLETKFK